MFRHRPASERGQGNHGWLTSRHTFSFAEYHDLAHMGFRSLRVMNEDRVAPGQGFGTHGHRDMEIISYVLAGELQHADSLNNGEVLRPGELQRMTAGSGIRHSEFNPSKTEEAHFYQIWITPNQTGLTPEYEQRSLPPGELANRLKLVCSPTGSSGSMKIHQDASIFIGQLDIEQVVSHSIAPGRHAWLQVLRGEVVAHGLRLVTGDGLAVSDEPVLNLQVAAGAELMLFELT